MEWFSAPEYWLGRLVLERGVAAVYLIAFAVAASQFRALIGQHRLLPVPQYVARQPFWRTPQWAPYHLRLDWLMWFAGISPAYAQPWLNPLLTRLLRNDPRTLRLLWYNPFPASPPRFVRAQLYRYRFTTVAEWRRDRAWWHRTLIGRYAPPVTLGTVPAGQPRSGHQAQE